MSLIVFFNGFPSLEPLTVSARIFYQNILISLLFYFILFGFLFFF